MLLFYQFSVSIDAVQITELIDRCERNVRHAKFFSLIYIRSSLHHVNTSCQHLCRYIMIFCGIIGISGYRTWLIVILPEQTVPGNILQTFLPFGQNSFHLAQIHLFIGPFVIRISIHIHVFKLEYHIQLFFIASCVFFSFFQSHTGTLAYGNGIRIV